MSFCKGLTQGGSNADVVIVDSYVKSLSGVDWDQAYMAVVKDAEEQPPNWDIEGRGGLESWKTVGYIPFRDFDHGGMRTRSVSRTMEYAYNGRDPAFRWSGRNKLMCCRLRHCTDGQRD